MAPPALAGVGDGVVIKMARVDEIRSTLAVAGAGWATIARALPEYKKHSLGVAAGIGVHRPWVLLDDWIENWDAPPRLVRHESGRWFLKGERLDPM